MLIVFLGNLLYAFYLFGLTIPSLTLTFLLFGGISAGLFQLVHGGHLGVSREKALQAFVLVVSLASSGAYLLLAFVFAILTGKTKRQDIMKPVLPYYVMATNNSSHKLIKRNW